MTWQRRGLLVWNPRMPAFVALIVRLPGCVAHGAQEDSLRRTSGAR
jgi:hypothetical protein